MVVVFIDGSKIIHSIYAKASICKAKNELYIDDNGQEYIYQLDSVWKVELEC